MEEAATNSRYVIQRHHYAGFDHFDFMFERTGHERLRAFQLPEKPTATNLAAGISTREITPHRREYLTYEGEISGERGQVQIWDAGALTLLKQHDGFLQLDLQSDNDRRHPTWTLIFTGGTCWHLVAPNVAGRWALDYL